MYIKDFCRLCLRKPKNSIDLFINNASLLNKINFISLVKIEIDDDLPGSICEQCEKSVEYTYNFLKLIKHSDDDLKSRLQTLTNTNNQIKQKQIKSSTPISISTTSNEMESTTDNSYEKQSTEKPDEDIKSEIKIENDPLKVNNAKKTRIYNCNRCEAKFRTKHKYETHRVQAHRPRRICPVCGAKLLEYNFKKHMEVHSPPQECNVCGKTLKNISTFKFHLARRHGKPKIICQFCGKNFVVASEYKRHALIHTDPELAAQIRARTCTVCGKTVASMKKHMLTHTGEKPYVCSYCNKGFQAQNGLKIHIRLHTKEKPYICEYCGDAFNQKGIMKTHVMNKHINSKN